MDKIPMTADGYAALQNELKHRQQIERPRIIQQITDARTHGDLSENAEYHAAKETQSHNETRIAELEDKFANPYLAAERGFVDEVIEPSQTRPKLISALSLLENKRDSNPPKKHGNIPL